MMDLNGFQKLLEEAINEKLKENEHLRFSEVRKNNGLILHGISIFDGREKITPTIYIEEFFRRYEKGQNADEIAEEILTLCRKGNLGVRFDIEGFIDFKKARERIVFKLINTAKNEELLKEIPSIPFLDLSMVFYYLLGEEKSCRASILIRNEHMKNWGVDTAALYEAAKTNLPKLLPIETIDMKSMVRDLMKEQFKDIGSGEEEDILDLMEGAYPGGEDTAGLSMYVMTNRDKFFGAAGIACREELRQTAEELKSDLYILPSSVHEVILLPVTGGIDPGQLKDMVRDVNRTQLSPEEVLSDCVYRYSREGREIRIVDDAGALDQA